VGRVYDQGGVVAEEGADVQLFGAEVDPDVLGRFEARVADVCRLFRSRNSVYYSDHRTMPDNVRDAASRADGRVADPG
jgi:hypothetical protein